MYKTTNAVVLYKTTFLESFIYGIPNTIHFTIWVRYYYNILFYQFLIFYFMCSYLIIKIKTLNANAIRMVMTRSQVWKLIRSYHSIADEIHDYNVSYWSKFILNFWLTYGVIAIIMLYMNLFVSTLAIIKMVLVYVFFSIITSFLMLIFNASSVNHWANCSHDKFNYLFVSFSQKNSIPKRSYLLTKLKVCYFK